MERESAEMVHWNSVPRRGDEVGARWATEEQTGVGDWTRVPLGRGGNKWVP